MSPAAPYPPGPLHPVVAVGPLLHRRTRVPNTLGPCAASARRACHSWLNRLCNDWLFRSCKRTFSPFHRGVVTGYALEVGAAEQGENRDPLFSAFGAVRYRIHQIPPGFFTRNSEL
jgi:hypothetical protein